MAVAPRIRTEPTTVEDVVSDLVEVIVSAIPRAQTLNLLQGDIAGIEVQVLAVAGATHSEVMLVGTRPTQDADPRRLELVSSTS